MKLLKIIIPFVSGLSITFCAYSQKDFTKEADDAFREEKYYKAIELYKKALTKEKSNDRKVDFFFKIGECYRLTEDTEQSQEWYEKAIKANYPDPIAILYFADAIKAIGKYDEALIQYKIYSEKVSDDSRGTAGIKSCELAKKWKDNPGNFEIKNEALLNSVSYDFSPAFADKKYEMMIFSSSREGSTGKDVSERTGETASDLYYSLRDKKGVWGAAALLNPMLNTENEEGAAVVNSKKNYIYFTRCHPKVEKSKEIICHIYGAKKVGQKWDGVEIIPLMPDSINVGNPALSPDDNIMIFVANDMTGGVGQRDLWYSKYDAKQKKWQEPVNLGNEINTSGNEMFPYLHEDGTLYFASDGHAGMGKLDIFKAEKLGPEKWSKVENLKSPINTAQNDFGIIFEGKTTKGYFTSDRPGGKGADDIYSFFVPPITFALDIKVYDADTKKPIEGAIVKLSYGSSAELKTDKTGYCAFETNAKKERIIKENMSCQIFVSKEKFLNGKEEINTVGVRKSTRFYKEIFLQNISEPTKEIRFPEVLYDLGKWELGLESKDSLNFLYQILIDNPNIAIELAAHTDSRPIPMTNEVLSQKRAEECVEYLIEKGISADRLIPKGYGASRLLISDKEIAKMKSSQEKDAAHQKNRRTVFRVIRSNYLPYK